MPLQHFKWNDLERAPMGGGESDRCAHPSRDTFKPARSANTPAVAGFQPRKFELRSRSREVVAAGEAEGEKFLGNLDANGVAPLILGAGVAKAVAEEAGDRFVRARLQGTAKNIARGKRSHRRNVNQRLTGGE